MKYFYLFSLMVCVTFCSAQTATKQSAAKKSTTQTTPAKKTTTTTTTKKSTKQTTNRPPKGYGEAVQQSNAQYPGGEDSLAVFLQRNFKYTVQMQEKGKRGTINVGFTVSKEGKITDPVILNGATPEVDEEVLRIVMLMPSWKPGTAGGAPVDVQYILPIDYFIPE